jgi:pimeloyl-ACP methyl ester carboxylesterase
MELAWTEHGDAGQDGEPVLCLPGFGMDRSVMAAAMEPVLRLRPGFRRIYVDLPGHGESPAGVPTSAAAVRSLAAFIDDQLAGGPVLLAGWSYGGYLAAALARRRPAHVTGLLLVCAGIRIRPEDRDLPGQTEPAEPAGPAALAADPGLGHWLDGVPTGLRDHLATAIGNRTAEVAGTVTAALLASLPGDEEYQDRLRSHGYQLPDEDDPARYQGPACLIAGRQDQIAGYADQFRALGSFPAASYSVVAEAGHYLPFEQPASFRAIVLDWLDNRVSPVLDGRRAQSVPR